MVGKVPLVGLDKYSVSDLRKYSLGLDPAKYFIKFTKDFNDDPVINTVDDTSFIVNDCKKHLELCEWLKRLPNGAFSFEETTYSNVDRIIFTDRNNAIKFKLLFGHLKTPISTAWRNFTIIKNRVNSTHQTVSAQYKFDRSFSMSIQDPNKPTDQ